MKIKYINLLAKHISILIITDRNYLERVRKNEIAFWLSSMVK
jgi:hypothetical protein